VLNTNSIPEPNEDPASMLLAIRALKEVVEGLTGQRPGKVAGAPRVFLQPIAPDARAGFALSRGDFWISSGTDRLHYWDGRLWRQIQP